MNIVINSNIAIFFTMIYRGNKFQYRPALLQIHPLKASYTVHSSCTKASRKPISTRLEINTTT